ncbi:hypothetical protein NQ107_18885, partial [Escherichia coli]|nr:hypothetical protein [Escherichia coli]
NAARLWAKFSYGQTLLYFYALKGNLYCLRANFIVSSHLIARLWGSWSRSVAFNPLNRQAMGKQVA